MLSGNYIFFYKDKNSKKHSQYFSLNKAWTKDAQYESNIAYSLAIINQTDECFLAFPNNKQLNKWKNALSFKLQ